MSIVWKNTAQVVRKQIMQFLTNVSKVTLTNKVSVTLPSSITALLLRRSYIIMSEEMTDIISCIVMLSGN